ncbi:MAG: TPR end-of-group domain-containing protein [Planctomycetota bacterium]
MVQKVYAYSLKGDKEKSFENPRKTVLLVKEKKEKAKKCEGFRNLRDNKDFKKVVE